MCVDCLERRNCADADPEIFFPEKASNVPVEVLAYCGPCPVREVCAQYAVDHNLSGIWGGTSKNQRRGRSAVVSQDVCRNNHPRTPENTQIGSTGRRRCRICITEGSKRAYAVRLAKGAGDVA